MANSEIRVGRVSSINYESGMIRVTYHDKDDSVTAEYPLLTNNDEYIMPEMGQDVIVAHLSNGSSRGAIIGTLWNKKHIPYETGKELYRKELSRKKDAAYIRYSDENGEYLLKVANIHLNGVNKTILDGPRLEISANISMLLEAEDMHIDTEELLLTGGKLSAINADVKADINIAQRENTLEAEILKATLEFAEDLKIKAGTDIQLSADEQLAISGAKGVEISSGEELRFSDGKYSITLSEIMEMLGSSGG